VPAPQQRPTPEPAVSRRSVDDFAQSIHASYLSRWLRHDPDALEKAARETVIDRKPRKRTSAA